MAWFCYIAECADGTYYAGIATDVERRMTEHNAGVGAKYTRSRIPVTCVWSEEHPDRSSASKRERELKSMTRAQKERLVNMQDAADAESLPADEMLKESVLMKTEPMFEEQLSEAGLDVLDNWKGDVRLRLEAMLSVLVEDTPYSFRLNRTDGSSRILELHRLDHAGRLAGFIGKRDGTITAFFNRGFYDEVNQRVALPENMWPSKSQPHVKLTVAELWNVMCAATGKMQCRAAQTNGAMKGRASR